jgi:hypothetical protein
LQLKPFGMGSDRSEIEAQVAESDACRCSTRDLDELPSIQLHKNHLLGWIGMINIIYNEKGL